MIEHDEFVEWARSQFGDIRVHGNEVQIPDIWWEAESGGTDNKLHCWANTEKNCFHAFKSGTTGSLAKIVMEIEGCDWEDALDLLGGENSIRALGARLHKLYSNPQAAATNEIFGPMQLPAGAKLITSYPPDSLMRSRAEGYLARRKLSPECLMICEGGDYHNRIVIPYYNAKNELVYFNSRAIDDSFALRYKGPPKELCGIGKADVIWMRTWPEPDTRIYLTEGEFDAMAVIQSGLPAAACGGKAVSDLQKELLRPYRITVAFDNDKAGREGLQVALDLKAIGFRDVKFIWPPDGTKDWNELLIKYGEGVVRGYITSREQPVTQDTLTRLGFKI